MRSRLLSGIGRQPCCLTAAKTLPARRRDLPAHFPLLAWSWDSHSQERRLFRATPHRNPLAAPGWTRLTRRASPEAHAAIPRSRRDTGQLLSALPPRPSAIRAPAPGVREPRPSSRQAVEWRGRSLLVPIRQRFLPAEPTPLCWISESTQANHSPASQFASRRRLWKFLQTM